MESVTGSEHYQGKAVREGYSPAGFFFRETGPGGLQRFVAWTPVVSQLKEIVTGVLQLFPQQAEVLFKVVLTRQGEDIEWRRWYGECELQDVLSAIDTHQEVVFEDGDTTLCVRDPATEEYLALDDHGILFIYSGAQKFSMVLKQAGLEECHQELLFQSGHWHRIPKNAKRDRRRLIAALGLKPVR